MAVEINWTDSALEDISHIAEFISKDSFYYAQIQSERFFSCVQLLERFPHYGKMVPELSQPDLREIVEGNYRIIYRIISEDRIDILRIHHSSRILFIPPFFEEG